MTRVLKLERSFSVIDSHTAGHPTRVIVSGIPPLAGTSVLEQRRDFQARFDGWRGLLLHEPSGHAAMVGLVPVPSAVADHGAFFLSSYVYLDMCGHGTIGYAKTLAATGQLEPGAGEAFTLETPAGIVNVGLEWGEAGELRRVRLRNVPAYVGLEGLRVQVPGLGEVTADIVYGGMWYALVEARTVGLELRPDGVSRALPLGALIKRQLAAELASHAGVVGRTAGVSVLFHQDEPSGDPAIVAAKHLLVLEANKFDRSPCGTGTAARVAQLVRRGTLRDDQIYRACNLLGVAFDARVAGRERVGGREAVVAEIAGEAYVTAFATIVKEPSDPLKGGFLCR